LQQEHVPGTFFVVGKMVERYPQIAREIVRQGNEIANHTFSHTRLTALNDKAVLGELNQTQAVIRRLTGCETVLFRPPGGDYNRETVRVASHAGYHMVLWSILTNDIHGGSQKRIYRRIMKGAEDGGIVLMHSGMENSIDVLPRVIASLRQKGFHFVTVSTLMGLSSAQDVLPKPPEAPLPPAPQPVPPTLRQRLVYKTALHALL